MIKYLKKEELISLVLVAQREFAHYKKEKYREKKIDRAHLSRNTHAHSKLRKNNAKNHKMRAECC